MTDEATYYRSIGREFRYHFTVEHSIGEYVRGGAHTNTHDDPPYRYPPAPGTGESR